MYFDSKLIFASNNSSFFFDLLFFAFAQNMVVKMLYLLILFLGWSAGVYTFHPKECLLVLIG